MIELALVCLTVLAVAHLVLSSWRRVALLRTASAARLHSEELLRYVGDQLAAALERVADREPGPSLEGKTLVVHTRKPDDQSIRGICVADYGDRLVLRKALYYGTEGASTSAGGDIEIKWINVSTYQVVTLPQE